MLPSRSKSPAMRSVAPIMRRLKKTILAMELPAIERISEDEPGDAFRVLVATMLSAQTRDPVTHENPLVMEPELLLRRQVSFALRLGRSTPTVDQRNQNPLASHRDTRRRRPERLSRRDFPPLGRLELVPYSALLESALRRICVASRFHGLRGLPGGAGN
jgi:hypothetical protein